MDNDPLDGIPRDPFNDGDIDTSAGPGWTFPSAEGYEIDPDWKPTPKSPLPSQRCYYVRPDGTQCKRFALKGTGLNGTKPVCPTHGGNLPSVKAYAESLVLSARMTLIDNADLAVDTLLGLLQPGTADAVRLKAAESVLDRVGIKGAPDFTVEVEHKVSASEEINKRLSSIATRLAPKPEEPEDLGEVIDEPPTS